MSLEIVGPEIPFFHREGSTLRPTLASRGPWGEETLSGRAVAGLLGSEIERCHGHPEFVPVRLTVDMFRMSKMATVEISTKILRAGSRIKLVEAEFRNGGEVVAHYSLPSFQDNFQEGVIVNEDIQAIVAEKIDLFLSSLAEKEATPA